MRIGKELPHGGRGRCKSAVETDHQERCSLAAVGNGILDLGQLVDFQAKWLLDKNSFPRSQGTNDVPGVQVVTRHRNDGGNLGIGEDIILVGCRPLEVVFAAAGDCRQPARRAQGCQANAVAIAQRWQ